MNQIVVKPHAEIECEATTISNGGTLMLSIEDDTILTISKQGVELYSPITIPLERWETVVEAVRLLRTLPTVRDAFGK